ncbi:MAG: DUF58 domain-containing protein [Bryobacteraceae bacterium]|jgi:uncharacterized protein (DUF58 family)
MVPSARMIWLVAAVGFPAAVVAALWPAARPVAFAAIVVLAIAIIADAALRKRALSGIRVELPGLVRFFKDRDAEIRIRIVNESGQSRHLRFGIIAPEGIETASEDQFVQMPEGAPAAEFSWGCVPRQRGRYQIAECYLQSASPLGMWDVRRCDPVNLELRVYPSLRSDDNFKALRRGVEGMHQLRQLGRGREFEKLREYVPGDGLDELHWKATARRGRPITKVFQVERTQEVYVVIDASRLSACPVGGDTALERAISAALILGTSAERRGDLFGLAAFADQVEAFARARNGKAHYGTCRDAIYQLQPRPESPDFDEIVTFLRLRLHRRSLILFLTPLDDPVLGENFVRAIRLISHRHLVMVAMPRPKEMHPLFSGPVETTDAIYAELAGHLAWKHLRELEATLARQGVRLALLDPEKITSGLIGLYDEVKQRQLL